jgi:hypothetical protein
MAPYLSSLGVITYCTAYDSADGAVGSSVTAGGTGPYTFTWTDLLSAMPSATSARTGMRAGAYTLTIRDSVGSTASHLFVVRQPRERQAAPLTLGNSRPSKWSAGRNQFFIDEAPASSYYPPVVTAGTYAVSSLGLTESDHNSTFGFVNGAWHGDELSTNRLSVGGGVEVSSTGVEIPVNSSLLFGDGTWRIRYEEQNTELVFENLVDGVWLRRMIVD